MLLWCTVTSATVFAQKSVNWAKYPYVASEYALKSWNATQLAPAVLWRSRDLRWFLMKAYWQYLSGNLLKKMTSMWITKIWAFRSGCLWMLTYSQPWLARLFLNLSHSDMFEENCRLYSFGKPNNNSKLGRGDSRMCD